MAYFFIIFLSSFFNAVLRPEGLGVLCKFSKRETDLAKRKMACCPLEVLLRAQSRHILQIGDVGRTTVE